MAALGKEYNVLQVNAQSLEIKKEKDERGKRIIGWKGEGWVGGDLGLWKTPLGESQCWPLDFWSKVMPPAVENYALFET